LFGGGLLISGMCRPSKGFSLFAWDNKNWDPSMLFWFSGALLVTMLAFPMIQGLAKP